MELAPGRERSGYEVYRNYSKALVTRFPSQQGWLNNCLWNNCMLITCVVIDEFQINEINVDLRTSGFDNEVLSVDACAV